MRILVRLQVVSVVALAPALAVAEESSLSLNFHFSHPSYIGCDDPELGDAAHRCETLDPVARDIGEGIPHFLMIYVGGVGERGTGGVSLGIRHDPDVRLSSWTLCTGGSEIPDMCEFPTDPCWPESGSYQAFTWAGGCHIVFGNDDGVTKVGFMVVAAESDGRVWLTPSPRDGRAAAYLCDWSEEVPICEELLGIADATIGGTGGVNPCGESCPVPARLATWARVKGLYR